MLSCLFLFITINLFIKVLCIVNTTSGCVKGTHIYINNCVVNQYLNIPYAKPPVGELRFSKPLPLRRHSSDIIDGTKLGNSCITSLNYSSIFVESEDCLSLKIWTKKHSKGNAVMVWFHGGSLISESANRNIFNGSALAINDVVVVTVHYRLGTFGWLYGDDESAPGNVGLYDHIMALIWVKNIINFGGDPNRVTIFGVSAGGWTVTVLLLSPLSKGLFKRAIFESGAYFQNKDSPVLSKSLALSQAKDMAQHFNCSKNNKWLECLRTIDAKTLNSYVYLTAYPIYNTEILPLQPQEALKRGYFNHVNIMGGTTQNDTSALYESYYPGAFYLRSKENFQKLVETIPNSVSLPFPNLDPQRITDFYLKNVDTNSSIELRKAFFILIANLRIQCSTYFFAKQFAINSRKSKVFFYYWTYISRYFSNELNCRPDMDVCHYSELPYVFGDPLIKNLKEKRFSEYTMKLWTNFAKFGFPNDKNWPRFILNSMGNITFTKEFNPSKPNHIIKNIFSENCEQFWRHYFI